MTKYEYATKQLALDKWKKELQKIQLHMIVESMKADIVQKRIKKLEGEIDG